MENLLNLLEHNSRLSLEQLAAMLATTPDAVAAEMDKLSQEGIILGYETLIDWEKAGRDLVQSIIEVKVTPKRDYGFDEIARSIADLPEVESLYLMSGGYDLAVVVNGKTFKDIAFFVANRLSTMESVLSTGTHFVLRKYKDKGILFRNEPKDERGIAKL